MKLNVFTLNRPSVGSSVQQWCSGNEVIVCVRGDKGRFNLVPFALKRWGPHHSGFFLLYYFLFVSFWPQTVCHGADGDGFTRHQTSLSHHIPDQLYFFYYLTLPFLILFFSPCNLSLFWSSMGPTQEWSAQRKKLMKSSFPLKCGRWAEPVSTLSGLLGVSEFHTIDTILVHKEPSLVQDLPGVFHRF